MDRANPTTSPSVEPWGTLFTDTAAQILATAPDFLFFAEGTGQRNQPGTAFGRLPPILPWHLVSDVDRRSHVMGCHAHSM